jgi:hypothetical protein
MTPFAVMIVLPEMMPIAVSGVGYCGYSWDD